MVRVRVRVRVTSCARVRQSWGSLEERPQGARQPIMSEEHGCPGSVWVRAQWPEGWTATPAQAPSSVWDSP